jgi:hypothetical protein
MKALTHAVVLLACVGISLLGCSDKLQSPVTPTDQSAQGAASLQKTSPPIQFQWVMVQTSGPLDEFVQKSPNGKLLLRRIRETVYVTATYTDPLRFDLLSGPGEVEINGLTDFVTLTGQWEGKLTLTPTAVPGGQWDFTWHGKATFDGANWVIPLKEEGHGNGGGLTGMQCRLVNTITSPDIEHWSGAGDGVIISH